MEALGVAETIRLKVQQWSDGPTVTTVSLGVATMTPAAAALVLSGGSCRQGALRRQGQWPEPVGARNTPQLSLVA